MSKYSTNAQAGEREHITGFKREISNAAASSEDDFFVWFNRTRDKHSSFIRGSWDFSYHIAIPAINFLSKPEDKVALEIGHGGGRLLAAASRHFKQVVGVDIHEQNAKVEEELSKRGIDNFRLIQIDGKSLPLDDSSVDFIYSLIVFQHMEKFEIVQTYFSEISRVLRSGGISVIYFGRKTRFSENRSSTVLYWADRLLELLSLRNGYKELIAKVNHTNLIISIPCIKSLAKSVNLSTLGKLVSRKMVPDGSRLYGGQHGIILRKP